MAYAMLAGLSPVYGLYGAAVTPWIGALWGSLRQLAAGPIAIMSLLVLTTLTPMAEPGSERYVEMAMMAVHRPVMEAFERSDFIQEIDSGCVIDTSCLMENKGEAITRLFQALDVFRASSRVPYYTDEEHVREKWPEEILKKQADDAAAAPEHRPFPPWRSR